MKNKYNVTVTQMVSCASVEQNVTQANILLSEIMKDASVDLIVFPENFLSFGSSNLIESALEIQGYIPGFCEFARKHRVNIVLGTIPFRDAKRSKSTKVVSRSLVINQVGLVVNHYDKLHLFDVDVGGVQGQYLESDNYIPGDAISVTALGRLKMGLSICYDVRFPTLYQKLVERGVNTLILPSAFTEKTGKAHWEVLLRARAIETQCFLLASNQGGVHENGLETWGHSMIISPWGEVIAQCNNGVGFCSVEIDLAEVYLTRKSMPVMSHKRNSIYCSTESGS